MADNNEYEFQGDDNQWGGEGDVAPWGGEGDNAAEWNAGEATGDAGERTFEDVFRDAFLSFANLKKFHADPDHETVENADLIQLDKDNCFDFLFRIGQDDPKTTIPLTQATYTCNDLYDVVCDHGIDSKKKTQEFNGYFTILDIVRSLSSAFIDPKARGKKGDMTTILLGDIQGEGKSYARTSFTTTHSPQTKAYFDANPNTFIITEATLELNSAESKQWCKDILSHSTNILSIVGRQFAGSTFTIGFQDPSPTTLTIQFLGNDFNPVTKANLILAVTEFSNIVLPDGFISQWKWGVGFEEILTIPISHLLQAEVQLSLPAVGIPSQYLEMLPALIPYSIFDVQDFDGLAAKVPGLADVIKGNLNTTLDLRAFVVEILGSLLGGSDKLESLTLLQLMVQWAPLGFGFIQPFLSEGLTMKDLLSALQSLAALGRLVFARDFNNFNGFSLKCASGHAISFENKNVLKVDAFFRALDQLFQELTKIVDEYEANRAAAQ